MNTIYSAEKFYIEQHTNKTKKDYGEFLMLPKDILEKCQIKTSIDVDVA